MAITVEGVGGTGKAVVNLLHLARDLANAVGTHAPGMLLSVTDQDPAGCFPDVVIRRPADKDATFAECIPLTNTAERAVSRALFDPTELDLDISRGFYGNPKVAATTIGLSALPALSGSDTVVVVFSEIGGTGAGLGPRRVAALLADATKRRIIALVFGRYLSSGTGLPVAYAWLEKNGTLQPAEHRYFDCYRINVPSLSVGGDFPASGINPTPALLLATMFTWRVAAAADEGTLETFLRTNMRGDARELFRDVSFGTDPERFWLGKSDFIGELRAAAVAGSLNRLIRSGEEYRNAAARRVISADEIARAAWNAFSAPEVTGDVPPTYVDYDSGFDTTFASVPHRWAAADWFLAAAVSDPGGEQAIRFRKLIHHYLSGHLQIVPTGWAPFGEREEIYVLTTQPLDINSDDIALRLPSVAVGFFTRSRPFWTTHSIVQNLDMLDLAEREYRVDLTVTQGTTLATALAREGRASLGTLDRVPCAVDITCLIQQDISSWGWALRFTAADWPAFNRTINAHPLLSGSLEILEGGFDIGADGGYSCDVRGVNFVRMPLRGHDHIRIGTERGVQYYEVSVVTDALAPADRKRRVLNTSLATPRPVFAQNGSLGLLCANVEVVIDEH